MPTKDEGNPGSTAANPGHILTVALSGGAPWVDVQGSRSGVTVITCSPLDSGITAIIHTADHPRLSDLTVFNDSQSGKRAVEATGGSPVLRNMELHATNHDLPAVSVMVQAGSRTFGKATIVAGSIVNGNTTALSAAADSVVTLRNSSRDGNRSEWHRSFTQPWC